MKNKKIVTLLLAVSLLLTLCPFDFFNENIVNNPIKAASNVVTIEDSTIWDVSNAPKIIDDTEYIFKSNLTVQAGVQIILKNNSKIIVEGVFSAVGTAERPIVFEGTDDTANYSIYLLGKKEDDINVIHNVIFKKGGYNQCLAVNNRGWFRKALANDCVPRAALIINLEKGSFAVTNSQFLDNFHGINVFNAGMSSYVRESVFANNKEVAIYSQNQFGVDASQNCWMRPSGPKYPDNPNGAGEILIGEFNYYPWRNCGTEHQPVILLPGIGGSWSWKRMFSEEDVSSSWDFAPTVHTYDELLISFEDKDYEIDKDLKIVHYDWRQNNNDSVEEFLLPVIEELKKVSLDRSYNVIAHSMGGLVALDYIYSEKYNNEIDKLVLMGTPIFGSSKVYPAWEGGILPEDWMPFSIYLKYLGLKNSGKDYYDLIHEYIPSVKQLMPVYNYVINNKNQEGVNYWEMAEVNNYMFNLFEKIGQYGDNFHGGNILTLEGTNIKTAKEVFVDDYDGEESEKLWKDGYPNPYPFKEENLAGDGTVLNESSNLFFINNVNKKSLDNITHSQLPTKSVSDVHDFLDIGPVEETYAFVTENKMIFVLACPVDIKIIDPEGSFINKSQNQIDNAYFYSDGRDDGYKIVEIQDPKDGEYRLELTGNGDGEYSGFIYINNGENRKEAEMSGEIKENEVESFLVRDSAGALIVEKQDDFDEMPPLIKIISPENGKDYLSNEKIEINYEINDDKTSSGNLKTKIYLDNKLFDDAKIDLAFEMTGRHEFLVKSQDEAGNSKDEPSQFGSSATYNSLLKNLKTYKNIGLINRSDYRFFSLQLKHLIGLDRFLGNYRKLFFHKKYNRRNKRVIKIYKKIIDHRLDSLIWLAEKKIENKQVRGLVVDQMEFLRDSLGK